jgi:drug/metabolite transporter (DMT)-like permease
LGWNTKMIFTVATALGAAFCWAVGGMISVGPSRLLGALAFNRLRMSIVTTLLWVTALLTGSWRTLEPEMLGALVLSGIIGILLGDTLLFAGLRRVGPRRNAVVFATNAPMTVLLAWLFLGDTLPAVAAGGCLLVTIGVVIAILFGKRRAQIHQWESVQGPLWQGIAFGVAAALCQAVSVLIAKPVMQHGVDPVAASAVRTAVSALALSAWFLLPASRRYAGPPLTATLVGHVALSGAIGMALGMTLLLQALATGEAGLVATLSATSPILVLPVLWAITRERPAGWAWLGAACAVAGTGCLFLV